MLDTTLKMEKVLENFVYASNTNKEWMTKTTLKNGLINIDLLWKNLVFKKFEI